jgi:tetratricopeptide (TPR) repeat protein
MKKAILNAMLIAGLCLTAVVSTFGQSTFGTVHGTCKDAQGTPIADAQIVWQNQDNGRSVKLKTDKKGSFFSLGLEPGKYTVTVSKDGKVLDTQKNVSVDLGDNPAYDVDLKAIQEQGVQEAAKQQGVSAEQIKQQQEAQAKVSQYNEKLKDINVKLGQVNDMLKAQPPQYDQAIASLTEISQVVPNEDVIWYRLGSAYLDSAKTQTDPAERTKRNTEAYNDLQKAIELKKNPPQGAPAKAPANTPQENQKLAAYYDNLGAAAARLGKVDEAANDYKQAAEINPANAGSYYFNLGAILTNTATDANGKKAAAEAFDKAIQADPTKADAYYWKGSNLIALATADSSGKLSAPDGTAEAFQKYLELQPSGPHAEEAKQMLTALNQTIESSYGSKKGTTKKK